MPNIRLYPKGLLPGASAFLLRWKKQPPKGSILEFYAGGSVMLAYPDGFYKGKPVYESVYHKLPCQMGDTAFIPETWRIWLYNRFSGTAVIEYKSDGKKKTVYGFGWDNRSLQRGTKWSSPATMPNIACQHILLIGKVEAVQVGQLDAIEMQKIIAYKKDVLAEQFDHWYTTTCPDASLNDWCWYVEKGEVR